MSTLFRTQFIEYIHIHYILLKKMYIYKELRELKKWFIIGSPSQIKRNTRTC